MIMSCCFRLFDIKKYRSIQPIIERIVDRQSNPSEAMFLVDEALKIAGTDEFSKYNCEGEYGNLSYRILERTKDCIQEGKLLEIPDIRSDNMLQMIILVTCCPRFQLMTSIHVEEISDTHADYTDLWGMNSLNEELALILDILREDVYPLEIILEIDGIMGVFSKEQLAKIEPMVVKNIKTLADKKYDYLKKIYKDSGNRLGGNPASMLDVKKHINMLEFNNELYTVLKLANSHPDYTVLDEYNYD
jgi:hypothetical protein